MKKVILVLVCFLSFAVISHSDPPEGYAEMTYSFSIKNWAGQYIVGATATLLDDTWVDWVETNLVANDEGKITMHFVYPVDLDAPASVAGRRVTFSASGYQEAVHFLDSTKNVSIIMASSH